MIIVNAIWAWNELLIALVFLQDENRRTLMAGLTLFQGRYATNQPLVLAGVFISILPVRARLPRGPALLRARHDGRHRQVARVSERIAQAEIRVLARFLAVRPVSCLRIALRSLHVCDIFALDVRGL